MGPAGAGAMLVACRMAGLSALAGQYAGLVALALHHGRRSAAFVERRRA
jgi:hypothetical protein